LTGPAGPAGATGPQGLQGEQGTSGIPQNVELFSTPNTPGTPIYWTVPIGVSKIQVECWGGGGGGGGDSGIGGGGAYVKSYLSVTPGDVHEIEVGIGGLGTGSNAQGGTSRFDFIAVAFGGSTTYGGAPTQNKTAPGGTGVGQLVQDGRPGAYKFGFIASGSITLFSGGDSPFGGFGADSLGRDASFPGGGGYGYGSGANGRVIITY
jgi:hypothetical protein